MHALFNMITALMAAAVVTALPSPTSTAYSGHNTTSSTNVTSTLLSTSSTSSNSITFNTLAKRSKCNKKVSTICAGCMSCTAQEHGLRATYHVHIGQPLNATRCERLAENLNAWKTPNVLWYYQCDDDCKGGTYIKFNFPTKNQESINTWLDAAFPELEGERKVFNCPGH